MTRAAEAAGSSRESLYKSLSGECVPDFSTVLKVMKSLVLKLHTDAAYPTIHRVIVRPATKRVVAAISANAIHGVIHGVDVGNKACNITVLIRVEEP